MKLSFIIPAYNEEDLIGKCLDSILKQAASRLGDIEIIVVNNASTDKTREIALSFPGVIVVDEPQKGIVHARHAGFLASSGDLIANIDADTMLTPGWIDKILKAFSDNQNLVALSGPHIFYDLSRTFNFWARLFYGIGFVSYLLNRFIFRVGSMIQGGNFVVKRSALQKIGGYNSEFDFWGEDSDIARRLHSIGDVKFTFNLPIYASGRRIVAEGAPTIAWRYGINYFWTIFLKNLSLKLILMFVQKIKKNKNMNRLFEKHKFQWSQKSFLFSALLAFLFLASSLVVNYTAGNYANEKASNGVTDIILDNLPVVDVDIIYIYGAILFGLFIAALLIWEPKQIPFIIKSIALFVFIRAIFISLTHLGPILQQAPPVSNIIFRNLMFGADYFFPGIPDCRFLWRCHFGAINISAIYL